MFNSWKRLFWAGILFALVATVLRQVEALLTMKYYLLPAYAPVWSKIMMPTAGPPPAIFFVLSVLFSLLTGWSLAAFYAFVKDGLPSGTWTRVWRFTAMTFGLSVIFFLLPTILLINLPVGLLVSWTVTTLLIFFFGSMVFGRVIK